MYVCMYVCMWDTHVTESFLFADGRQVSDISFHVVGSCSSDSSAHPVTRMCVCCMAFVWFGVQEGVLVCSTYVMSCPRFAITGNRH